MRDVARGLYGRVLPVRPAPGEFRPSSCLRGHALQLATVTSTYHHLYDLTELTTPDIGSSTC